LLLDEEAAPCAHTSFTQPPEQQGVVSMHQLPLSLQHVPAEPH
jgi:hypothetical protein